MRIKQLVLNFHSKALATHRLQAGKWIGSKQQDPRQVRMVEKYTHGHHQSVVKVHNARSVEDSAAFVLPLLQPHFKLLDVGCGPGSITQGFREYVKEVVGVDTSEEVIAQAKATCDAQNVQFQVASVLVAY